MEEVNNQRSYLSQLGQFTFTWAPRTIVFYLGGFYSLGLAYHHGLMARIDQIAIRTFVYYFGYTGLGAFMPTFQWYSAWVVRVVSGFLSAVLYDIVKKIVSFVGGFLPQKCIKA